MRYFLVRAGIVLGLLLFILLFLILAWMAVFTAPIGVPTPRLATMSAAFFRAG